MISTGIFRKQNITMFLDTGMIMKTETIFTATDVCRTVPCYQNLEVLLWLKTGCTLAMNLPCTEVIDKMITKIRNSKQ